jgi:hypothetical protein
MRAAFMPAPGTIGAGATHTVHSPQESMVEAVLEAMDGLGAGLVIEAANGMCRAVAVEAARDQGTMGFSGYPERLGQPPLPAGAR